MASPSQNDIMLVGNPLSSTGLRRGLWTISEEVWTFRTSG
jgi:hypothetical protein